MQAIALNDYFSFPETRIGMMRIGKRKKETMGKYNRFRWRPV
jgi:hypothetical protein